MHRLFFLLLLALLPSQLGIHFWPEWTLVLGRRVDYLAPTFYLTDLLVFLTVGCWLLPWFVQWARRNPKSKFLNPKQIQRFIASVFTTRRAFSAIILLVIMINISISTNQPVAIYKWLKAGELALIGWYIVKTKPHLSMIAFPLSIGVFYSSGLAIAQFVLQRSVGGILWWMGERTFTIDTPGIARINFCGLSTVHCALFLRPYATFPHPNVLGGYLAVLLPGIIQYTNNQIIKSSNRKKIFYLSTFLLGVVALFLTFSRSAIVVGGVVILAAVVNLKSQISNLKSILIVLVLASLLPLFAYHFSLITPLLFNNESVVIRQQLNAAAIKLWQQSPLFGIGLGNYLVKLPEALPSRTIYFLQPVHNIYLLLLSEVGVVGAGLILWLAWLLIQSKTSKTSQKFFLVLLVALLTLLLLGFVDHYPLTLQQGQLLFVLFVALAMAS